MKLIGVTAAALSLALGLVIGTSAALAQDKYPVRAVKLVVPYAPGGATDIVARILGEQLRQILGQPFVVENKPGANGILAINELVNARPDGYTLMIGNVTTNAITPVLSPTKVRNYETSVVPITNLVDIPAFLLATAENFPVRSTGELIDYGRRYPGMLRYGTVGAGSYPHYDMALFAKRAGDLDMIAIHNKAGAAGVLHDMIRGDTQIAFLNVASSVSQVQAGLLRPLAVANPSRLPEFPDVPTMEEVGYPGVGTIAWQALFAPAQAPKQAQEILFAAVQQALRVPSVVEAFHKQNFIIMTSRSLEDAKAWLAGQINAWRDTTAAVKIDSAD